jgi:N-acetylglucosaminyldiphosphoundecaprenol N-acetyl-beta-D-mannosaminyltransferase
MRHMLAPDDAPPPIRLLGIPIAQVSYAHVLDRMEQWLAARPPGSRTLVAANVHVITETAIDASYGQAVLDADLVVPDGMPLVWATRALGGDLHERCYGPTLMERSLEHFQVHRARHFLYGATDPTLALLRTRIAERWPGAIVSGALAPPFGVFDDRVELANIQRINATRPDFVWLAMGCPKQEFWMQRYRQHVTAAGILAVGAAFDFIAGTVRQAPPWMQRLGLEWAFRLAVEPRRLWRRYLIRNPYFALRFLLQYLQARATPGCR